MRIAIPYPKTIKTRALLSAPIGKSRYICIQNSFHTTCVPAIGRLSRKRRACVARASAREARAFILSIDVCHGMRGKYIFIIIARRRRRFTVIDHIRGDIATFYLYIYVYEFEVLASRDERIDR
uniref:Uncharacterized protein n=1 Tax=Trichogramma kaykai TaxID=54128 RepID=A0ABD2XCK0_9HYME